MSEPIDEKATRCSWAIAAKHNELVRELAMSGGVFARPPTPPCFVCAAALDWRTHMVVWEIPLCPACYPRVAAASKEAAHIEAVRAAKEGK